MQFDSTRFGIQETTDEDRAYAGSRYSEIREAVFSNAYYQTWGVPGEAPLPVYGVTLRRTVKGLLSKGRGWLFKRAAQRAIESRADLRWGSDGLGYRRLLHPNGICLFGKWIIDEEAAGTDYSGYFQKGREALIVARYSTCCTATCRPNYRSLSLVGKLFPTNDKDHVEPLHTASFITQEDIGGSKSHSINDAVLRNAPNVTPWRRGFGLPILLLTGFAFKLVDSEPTIRQLYEIAELGKPKNEPTKAPEFMQLIADSNRPDDDRNADFREEILDAIYDRGDGEPRRELQFHIEVSDEGLTKGRLRQRRFITNWKRIGRLVFNEAVASYNGDFVVHFHHPPWRKRVNDPTTVARRSTAGDSLR